MSCLIVERGTALGKAVDSETLREMLQEEPTVNLVELERKRRLQTVSLKQALKISRLRGTRMMPKMDNGPVPRRARKLFAHVPTKIEGEL